MTADSHFLVTGGAGYIGGHVSAALSSVGAVTVIDDLSAGLRTNVPTGCKFVEGSILDRKLLASVLRDESISCVVHLAGRKAPGESVVSPEIYFETNVLGTQNLLQSMLGSKVRRLVFSSSCSVYGSPNHNPVTEKSRLVPVSPYGQSKLYGEWMVNAVANAHKIRTGQEFRWIALRYFNVIGSNGSVKDRGNYNLVPLAIQAYLKNEPITINGNDWHTEDGTCVRDYIDVNDLAEAHVLATRVLAQSGSVSGPVNVSTGTGHSVQEVLDAVDSCLERPLLRKLGDRRPGDPEKIVGSKDSAARVLGWTPRTSFAESVGSAVRAGITQQEEKA